MCVYFHGNRHLRKTNVYEKIKRRKKNSKDHFSILINIIFRVHSRAFLKRQTNHADKNDYHITADDTSEEEACDV